MDISSELSVASVEGAAEATVGSLYGIVNAAAPHYKAFGPVLSDAVRERLHALFGAAGVKPTQIAKRVNGAWGLRRWLGICRYSEYRAKYARRF